jgi:hypothetical protein
VTVVVGSRTVDDVDEGSEVVAEEGPVVDDGEATSSPQLARTRSRKTATRMRIVGDHNPAVQYTR